MAVKTLSDNSPQYYLDRLLTLVDKHNKNSTFNSWEENTEFHNAWADYWRYYIGVNVIPSIGKMKRPTEKWEMYQDKPIPEEIHNGWKSRGRFNDGIAIMMGRIWHRKDLDGYYIAGIDADNLIAIKELLTRNGITITPEKFAKNTIVEQHTNKEKMHFYVYTIGRPLRNKTSDVGRPGIDIQSIPAFEVKASSDFLMFGSPCINKRTCQPYQILGTYIPLTLNEDGSTEFQEFIDGICKKYGLNFNVRGRNYLTDDTPNKLPMEELFKPGFPTLEGHNRHERLLRMMESLLVRNRRILPLELTKELARTCNTIKYFDPPLDNKEFEKQWECALKFILTKGSETLPRKEYGRHHLGSHSAIEEKIRDLAEQVMSKYNFKTLKDIEEILYFEGGIYRSGGEQIIKIELEKIAGYSININKRNEIIGHIKYNTMVERQEFDKDIEIINVKNGLLNLRTGEIMQHTPDYLSLVQLPVASSKDASCPNIIRFFTGILTKEGISTIVRLLGYCLYRSTRYEKAFMLVGAGRNGKSVLIKLIESLVGVENISHVSLQELNDERFAAADIYCKLVNTYADLESERLINTGKFKTIVSGDSIRAQRKHQQPFNYRNFAKLIFSANKIPKSEDSSYAYYRRWVIIPFQKVFEGADEDTALIDKLTTEDELSGLLNLALVGLRKLIKEGGFKDIPIEKIRQDYEYNASIVKQFVDEQCVINLHNPGFLTLTTTLQDSFRMFCKTRGSKPLDGSVLGKELLEMGIVKDRITKYKIRQYCYLGIMTKEELRGKNEELVVPV